MALLLMKVKSWSRESTVLDHAAILAQTDAILRSAAFRSSKRSQEVLSYLVDHALQGDTDALKERVIGQEIFGRPLDYDTGQDSIVRAKVNEVRKRLAQYFDEAGASAMVRIDIPVGSYVPEFHPIVRHQPADPRARKRHFLFIAAATLGLAGLAGAIFMSLALREPPAFEGFWQPFTESPRTVTVCVGHPKVYQLFGPQVGEMLLAHRPGTMAAEVSASPLERRPLAVIVPDPHNYVGAGDAHAMAYLYGLFKAHKIACQIRRGDDISFAELRSSPSILIGASSNQWSVSLLNQLRYVPGPVSGMRIGILDRKTGKEVAALPPVPSAHPDSYVDYAVISRLVRSRTGEALLGVAGLSHYGTLAAAELVTNERVLEGVLREVPNWSRWRNCQLIIRVNVVIRAPEKPEMIASHVW